MQVTHGDAARTTPMIINGAPAESQTDVGHGLFAANRPGYSVSATSDGWDRTAEFLRRHPGPRRPGVASAGS